MSAREPLDTAFLDALEELARAEAPHAPPRNSDRRRMLDLFESMATSRHLDFAARGLKAQDLGFYTIEPANRLEAPELVGVKTVAGEKVGHGDGLTGWGWLK